MGGPADPAPGKMLLKFFDFFPSGSKEVAAAKIGNGDFEGRG